MTWPGWASVAVALLIALPLAAPAQDAAPPPEPGDYRGEPYNAPVPATLAGAQVIDGDGAIALHQAGAVFIDVYPRVKQPEGLPEGTIWRAPRHDTIPGAIWLWDTGYQNLHPTEQARLTNGLAAATGGDKSSPVVIFCRADCWMSWNAARRAVAEGYAAVSWFPGGIDDWMSVGGDDLVKAEPVDP